MENYCRHKKLFYPKLWTIIKRYILKNKLKCLSKWRFFLNFTVKKLSNTEQQQVEGI